MYCIGRGPSQFCEMSAKVTNWETDVSVNFCGMREGIWISPLTRSMSLILGELS